MTVFDDIAGSGLTHGHEERLIAEFGPRGRKALRAVRSGNVKKYRDFFVVKGSSGEYVVEDDFCTCNDYLYRLSVRGGACYHAIAVRIAKATGDYEAIDQWYADVRPGPAR